MYTFFRSYRILIATSIFVSLYSGALFAFSISVTHVSPGTILDPLGIPGMYTVGLSGIDIQKGQGAPSALPSSLLSPWAYIDIDTGGVYIYNGSSWNAASGGSTSPGGDNGYMQFNNSGSFGASGLFWDNHYLAIGTESPTALFHIKGNSIIDVPGTPFIPGTPAVPGTIGSTSYLPSGGGELDDATFGGGHDGTDSCTIGAGIIDTAPGNGHTNDRFIYGEVGDNCSDISGGMSPIEITPGVPQALDGGVTITFTSGTGHTPIDLDNFTSLWMASVGVGIAEVPDVPAIDDVLGPGDDPFVIEKFDGSGNLFEVASNGYVTIDQALTVGKDVNIASVSYTWPTMQAGGSGYVLTNNGSGGLSWADPSGGITTDATYNNIFSDTLEAGANLDGAGGGIGNLFLGYRTGKQNTTGSYNVFLGHNSGKANTTGIGNVFSGVNTGFSNTTGSNNIFSGYTAGTSNTTGSNNIFMGDSAGFANSTASNNIFLGRNAGFFNSDGTDDIFIGRQAGASNTTGSNNVFSGYNAGQGNTEGYNNVFLGGGSGYSNTTGNSNIFLGGAGRLNSTGAYNFYAGEQAGDNITNGGNNVFLGYRAGYGSTGGANNIFIGQSSGNSNTSGNENIFLGEYSGNYNTTGYNNIFLGYQSGSSNTSGQSNVFLGPASGDTNETGDYNTIIGREADVASSSTSNAIALGYEAVAASNEFALPDSVTKWKFQGESYTLPIAYPVANGYILTASDAGVLSWSAPGGTYGFTYDGNNLFAGTGAGSNNTSGVYNIFIGNYAGLSNTLGNNNLFFGWDAGHTNTEGTDNLFFGSGAGYANLTGYNNIFLGSNTGNANISGINNIFFGTGAGANNTTGGHNIFTGVSAGHANTEGEYNAFIGYSSGYTNTTGGGNIFFGGYAGQYNTTGDFNTFIGHQAGQNQQAVDNQVAIGYQALIGSGTPANNIGTGNIAIGSQTGYSNTEGNSNVFIGLNAGYYNTTGSNNIFSGWHSGYANTIGGNNIFTGPNAGIANTEGNYNIFSGARAGYSNTTGSNNIFFGQDAGLYQLGVNNQIAIGVSALAGSSNPADNIGTQNTAIGYRAGFVNVTGQQNVYLGYQAGVATTEGQNNTILGAWSANTLTTGSNNVFVGTATNVASNNISNSIILGYAATATAASQFIVGSAAAGISDIYIGKGVTSSNPADTTFNVTGGEGTNIAGATLKFASGKATGSAQSGSIIFQTSDIEASGTTLQTLSTKMILNSQGNVGIGDDNICGYGISSKLQVHRCDELTVSDGSTSLGLGVYNEDTNSSIDGAGKYGMYVTSTGSFAGDAGSATSNYGIYVGAVSGADDNYPIYSGTGAYLSSGGTWTDASSKTLKENYTDLDKETILSKISQLTIQQWNYISQDDSVKHIGPYAEDFKSIFNIGESDKALATLDTAGVALIGIQALDIKIKNIEALLTGGTSIADQFTGMILHVKSIVFGTQDEPSGFTMYDTVTKEPYCVTLANGDFVKTPGECGAPEDGGGSGGSGETGTTSGTGGDTIGTSDDGSTGGSGTDTGTTGGDGSTTTTGDVTP